MPLAKAFSRCGGRHKEEKEEEHPGADQRDNQCAVEIHARNASHLVGQVIGDRRLQRKEADQDGDEQGGQAAVEQLAYQIGAHGQAAAPDEGEHLTVDGDAGPPQHEGGQNKLAAEGAVAGESPHTGGDLQRSGKQTLGPLRGEAEGGEHRPQHLGQPGQEAGADKELNHHGEKDHKGADVQRGQKGVFDGAGKGCCEALGVELGPGLPLLPPGGWAGLVNELMKKIVWEQNERRKSELDVLQSQINPHFLYNTLDSITWMIEGGKNEEASFMITQLEKLFRISLSKGHTIIPVRDELLHAKSYMNIQKVRYKNKFEVSFEVDEEIMDYCAVKLVLQPILENALNYGIRELDDFGEIVVGGQKVGEDIIITVSDNGMGIPENEIPFLLTNTDRVHKKGSGVGLVNVNNRIKILFGERYGLHIESELDEGTVVTIKIPAIVYSEENRLQFEEHHIV